MALVESILSDGVAALPNRTDPVAAAAQFALIYQTYAATAQASATVPIFTGTEQARFAAVLAAQFQNTNGTVADFANAFVQAMTVFWLTPPVPFGTNPPPVPLGAVSAWAGGPILLAAIEALCAVDNTLDVFAAGLAAALDAATRAVVVTLPGPVQVNLT